jgi:2-polyprenyl-3-methyl-5-hydroxy-6-metoxy-1,4-benzoquinol methylase
MEKIINCLVCGGNNLKPVFSCNDFVASNETFNLDRCDDCSFLFTNPRPYAEEIYKYYQSDKYISHSDKKEGLGIMYKIYDIIRNFSIKSKLKLIKKYNNSGNLMDLGCGLGYFLDAAIKDKTFKCIGVDISEDAIEYVKKSFNYDVINENTLDTHNIKYDVITQWHVLEHVHYLNERMVQLNNLLTENGTLFIAVPNSNSWDALHYKKFWDGFDVPRHLYHFNINSFTELMNKHNFDVKAILPLVFDAPYISMRSEIHKGSNINMLKGAFYGINSNLRALFNNEYSSLLFVVKKKSN